MPTQKLHDTYLMPLVGLVNEVEAHKVLRYQNELVQDISWNNLLGEAN
jgi:hypothetical protein